MRLVAIRPGGSLLGAVDVPIGTAALQHGAQVEPQFFHRRPAEKPVTVVDLVDTQARLEHQRVRDHRIVSLHLRERAALAAVIRQLVVRKRGARNDVGSHRVVPSIWRAACLTASWNSPLTSTPRPGTWVTCSLIVCVWLIVTSMVSW